MAVDDSARVVVELLRGRPRGLGSGVSRLDGVASATTDDLFIGRLSRAIDVFSLTPVSDCSGDLAGKIETTGAFHRHSRSDDASLSPGRDEVLAL